MFPQTVSATVVFMGIAFSAWAQPESSKTAAHVKVQATTNNPNEAGEQLVTIVVDVNDEYILVGHEVSENFDLCRLQAKVLIRGKPVEAKVQFPAGKMSKDPILGNYNYYEGKATCKATLRREAGDSSPVEVILTMQCFHKSLAGY